MPKPSSTSLDFKSLRYPDFFVIYLDDDHRISQIYRYPEGRITRDPMIYSGLESLPPFHKHELEQYLYSLNRI